MILYASPQRAVREPCILIRLFLSSLLIPIDLSVIQVQRKKYTTDDDGKHVHANPTMRRATVRIYPLLSPPPHTHPALGLDCIPLF